MLKTTLLALLATAAAALAAPAEAAEDGATTMEAPIAPKKTGHVPANGVNYYYAIYGEGEPLLLLHGGLGQIEMFGPNLAALAEGREVIGVDLHGHGRTQLGDRPIDLKDIGDDLAIVLDTLGYDDRSTCSAIRSAEAPRSGWRCSTRTRCGGSVIASAGSPRTASSPRCCRCRPPSAPAWPR